MRRRTDGFRQLVVVKSRKSEPKAKLEKLLATIAVGLREQLQATEQFPEAPNSTEEREAAVQMLGEIRRYEAEVSATIRRTQSWDGYRARRSAA